MIADYLNSAYLLLGTNIGNRLQHIQQAITLLHKTCGKILYQSSLYETAAWGHTQQPAFINQCILLKTKYSAEELIFKILNIELKMGRVRTINMGPRVIDIDIILFNNDVIDTPNLQVPHPRMHLRKFVLTPLAEIAGDIQHPLEKKSINELLKNCPDNLDVHKI